jgi:F-type H+-transporting ATPase subunit b
MTDCGGIKKIAFYAIISLFVALYVPIVAMGETHEHAAVQGEAAHGEAAHEEGEAHEHAAPIGDLFKRGLNFVALAGLLYYFVRKPAKNFFAGRRESIQNTLHDLEQQKREAEDKYKEYQQKLSALESEKQKIIEDFIKQGEAEKAKILEKANKDASRMKEETERTIQHEVKNAKGRLREEVADLATKMAEDLLRKHIRDADQERLVDEYLAKVVQAK